jgi:hypothetical protein
VLISDLCILIMGRPLGKTHLICKHLLRFTNPKPPQRAK